MKFNLFKRKHVKVDKDIYFKLRTLNKELRLLYKQKDLESIQEIVSNSDFIKEKTVLKIYKQCNGFSNRKKLGSVKHRFINVYNGIISNEVSRIVSNDGN